MVPLPIPKLFRTTEERQMACQYKRKTGRGEPRLGGVGLEQRKGLAKGSGGGEDSQGVELQSR